MAKIWPVCGWRETKLALVASKVASFSVAYFVTKVSAVSWRCGSRVV